MLPHDVVLRSSSEADARAAVADGTVVEVAWHGAPAWALADVAESEELLADGLLSLAEENRLAVVVGSDAASRRAALDRALGGRVAAEVLDDAHLVGLDAMLGAVEDLPEQAVLALSLDNALPLGPVTGAVALDLAASGACPVLVAERGPDRSALDTARREVAAGRWPAPAGDDRSFVAVRVSGPDEAVVRVAQLVSASVPRAFGVSGDQVAVLVAPGSVDPQAVVAALAGSGAAPGTPVVPTDDLGARTWPAVVAVLPAPGVPALTRALVYAALRAGTRHVSVVHGFAADDELAGVLAATTDRPRRTRLAELLES
ncbi:MAG: hypothetical protein U0S36_08435 [Candidatus Nanopelagicales bacterium]